MSALFKLVSRTRHLLLPSASLETRRKLRRLGMAWFAWAPYVAFKRRRWARGLALTDSERATVARLNYHISRLDEMYDGDVARYLQVGLSGLRAIEGALQKSQPLSVGKILDLPCGCGRVGRFLAARFPEARITACDLMTEQVDFCAAALGMTGVYSEVDFDKLKLGEKYDLIWCGSLVTHLNAKAIKSLLKLFDRQLNDGGLVVFSTHGDYVCDRVSGGYDYGIGQDASKRAVASYRAAGFAFETYLGEDEETGEYGISITSPAWIRSQCGTFASWREVFFQPKGWDHHQDVYGYAKGRFGE